MKDPLLVAPRVAEALASGRPVVALETTLVTHGLPDGAGLQVARELEEAVREGGCEPASVGALDGSLRVGLTPEELERLAGASDVAKLNLSNLAAQLAGGGLGSTTVAATMFAAHRAGIGVFATGGIGGVHLNVATTGDVSADLTALARFPVAVVCSGAKAVLDLPKTVEALETLGVPIFGLGTDRFPAFYRRDSGLPVDRGFEGVRELATAVRTHFEIGLGTGVVVAHPVPEEHELAVDVYEAALQRALADAERHGVRGRALTPFLLESMRALTEGASLFSNRALLVANARAAGRLARAMSSPSE
jgi:pseudouridine-5'-phosphate glycosidase